MNGAEGEIGEVLVPAETLQARIQELAAAISRDYAGKDLLLVGILRGAAFFLVDLARGLSIPAAIDFMAISSYGPGSKSSGVVKIIKDLDESIADRHVLIVEDIVANINFFMNVPVQADGTMGIVDGKSKPGDYVELRAEHRVLAVISNCPQTHNPCNGFNPTPIRVLIYEPTG